MRALITLGDNIKEGIEAIQRENLFTGIVCVNAIGNENDTQNFYKKQSTLTKDIPDAGWRYYPNQKNMV